MAEGMMGGPGGARPGGTNRPSLRRAMEVFQHRNYRLLWLSSLFSFTGMQMQQVARALLAWQLTGSYAAVGIVSLSFGLPMLLFALIGGSLADRVEKRNLTLVTQGSTGLLALVTAVLVATGVITIEQLFVIGLVQGTFFAFGMPARTPLMVEVVGPDKMMSAIALSNAAMNFTRLFGPAIAGILISVSGIALAYFVQSGLYVFSTAFLILVPLAEGRRAALAAEGGTLPGDGAAMGRPGMGRPGMGPMGARPQGSMFKEIGVGLSYVWGHKNLKLLIGMMFVVSLFGMPYIMLLPGFITDDLGQGEDAYGYLVSITGAGALVASLAVAAFTEFDRKPMLQWLAGALTGVGLIILAIGSMTMGFTGAILASIVLGVATTAYQTLNNTMVMSEADPEYYGRVMSINMLTFSVMPLMAFPLGLLADVIGAETTFILQGGVILGLMVIIAMLRWNYTFSAQASGPSQPHGTFAAAREAAAAARGAAPLVNGAANGAMNGTAAASDRPNMGIPTEVDSERTTPEAAAGPTAGGGA